MTKPTKSLRPISIFCLFLLSFLETTAEVVIVLFFNLNLISTTGLLPSPEICWNQSKSSTSIRPNSSASLLAIIVLNLPVLIRALVSVCCLLSPYRVIVSSVSRIGSSPSY
jgi:hypothetical protein